MRASAALLATVALLGGACGKGDTRSEPRGGQAPAAPGLALRPDDGSWSDDPAGVAWDACAWVPAGDETMLWVFDLKALNADPSAWQSTGTWHAAREARRLWVRTLGLPEAALGPVIGVEEPEHFFVCSSALSEDDLARALTAKGLVEVALAEGARGFRLAEAEQPIAMLFEGRLVTGVHAGQGLSMLAEVRRGKRPSLRDTEGVRAACAAAPKGLSVDIQAGRALRRRRPSEPSAPKVSLGVSTAGARRREVRVMACGSEAVRDEVRAFAERMVALRPDAEPDDVVALGVKGSVLRLTFEARARADLHGARSAAQELLRALAAAVEGFRSRRGALPTAAEGLGGLASEPELLDDVLGQVPLDPWGRGFVYQPAHPKRPDSFVLRSLGPDGEIDTEDDVLPEERER